jgi:DNA-3-methyladenine glycosylase
MSRSRPLPAAFYRRAADVVARELLGRWLVREGPGGRRVLRLVETEAYLGERDAASHAFRGRRTARNESMYLAGGHAYVYFVYGMHWCLNVVCAAKEVPQAVLLRAGAPVAGAEIMQASRGLSRPARPGEIAGGPGRLCAALAIDRSFDGADLRRGSLRITRGEPLDDAHVVVGPRVGVDYAGEAARWPLRFAERGSSEVSRPRPR